jgi:hypothetical protein
MMAILARVAWQACGEVWSAVQPLCSAYADLLTSLSLLGR